MIEGRKIIQVTMVFLPYSDPIMIEAEHKVTRFRRSLPAGPLPGGAVRRQDLLQFWSDPGGLRTVAAEDIVL